MNKDLSKSPGHPKMLPAHVLKSWSLFTFPRKLQLFCKYLKCFAATLDFAHDHQDLNWFSLATEELCFFDNHYWIHAFTMHFN